VNGSRAGARRLLADPAVSVVVVEHRDRLGRVNTSWSRRPWLPMAAAWSWWTMGEVTDDPVPDMIEVLTSFCARLCGRRSAWNRALKAVGCAQRGIGPQAVLTAGSPSCGGAG